MLVGKPDGAESPQVSGELIFVVIFDKLGVI